MGGIPTEAREQQGLQQKEDAGLEEGTSNPAFLLPPFVSNIHFIFEFFVTSHTLQN